MLRIKSTILLFIITVLLITGCKRSVIDPLPEMIITAETGSTEVTTEPADTTEPPAEPTETTAPEDTAEPPTDTPVPPTPTTEAPTPTNTPTVQPIEPTTVPTKTSGTIGEIWNLADVRYGLHEDFLRVVVEMAEARDTIPYYEVKVVKNADDPYPTGEDPSWGEYRIDLIVSDLYAYDAPIYGELPFTPGENPAVTRIGKYPTYDDALLGFSIGLVKSTVVDTFELLDPVRIVIDIRY